MGGRDTCVFSMRSGQDGGCSGGVTHLRKSARLALFVAAVCLALAVATWATRVGPFGPRPLFSENRVSAVVDEAILPATMLREPLPVTHVCSVGPYFDTGAARLEADKHLLARLDAFPVPESDGLFVYFTGPDAAPKVDWLKLNTGRFRWRADDREARCVQAGRAGFRVVRGHDHWSLSLVEVR